MLPITYTISLDESELEFHFVRSPGPGGQNVNKVATACQLRFDVAGSPSLPEPVKARMRAVAGKRLTTAGVLVITANRFRSQAQNREDAINRLVELIRRAATVPKPRRATKPTRASKRRRVESKRRRGEVKRARGPVGET
jgi:ribosome-associated protein